MSQLISQSVAQPRFYTLLLAAFALIAVLLAAVGVYSVISYAVSQRTHEIGIRMAVGASRYDVIKLVVSQGMLFALVGAALGLAAAFAVTRMMRNLLYGVSSTDPMTFIVAASVLILVAFAACYIPSRRAMAVDLVNALRYE